MHLMFLPVTPMDGLKCDRIGERLKADKDMQKLREGENSGLF